MNIHFTIMANNNQNPKTLKRRHVNSVEEGSWPRFVLIQGTNEDLPISKLSCFAIKKGVEGCAGTVCDVKKLRNGSILVEAERKSQSDNLLKLKFFVDRPVKVEPHRTLNSCKGVIWCRDLLDCSDEEILQELAPQHVVSIHRITVSRDGTRKATGTFILTVQNSFLPKYLDVGYLKVPVKPYIPNPIRCFGCNRYGHFKSFCSHKPTCARCGQEDHLENSCLCAPKCINCQGSHAANSKSCPKWIEEKQIQEIKTLQKVSYTEAKRQQNLLNVPVKTLNFAQAVSKKPTTVSVSIQTDLTWLDQNKMPLNIDSANTHVSKIASSSKQIQTKSLITNDSNGNENIQNQLETDIEIDINEEVDFTLVGNKGVKGKPLSQPTKHKTKPPKTPKSPNKS
jgi:hypothetical protein